MILKIRKIAVMLMAVVAASLGVFLLATGCTPTNRTIIDEIATETQSSYSFVTGDGITIDRKYYSFKSLAQSASGYSLTESNKYAHWLDYREDKTLFLYELKNTETATRKNSEDFQNYHMFDLGLFGVDNVTGKCTMYGLYKNVYPTYRYRGTYENIVAGTDGDNIILFYNGRLEVLDIEKNKTVYSRRFYADDAFKNNYGELPYSQHTGYTFTSQNDFVTHDGEKICFYKYEDGRYPDLPFTISYTGKFIGVDRLDQIFFVHDYDDNTWTLLNQFDLGYDWHSIEVIVDINSETNVDEEYLRTILRAEKAKRDEIYDNRYKLKTGEEVYTYTDSDKFIVTRERDNKLIELTAGYFEERSEAYRQIVKKWKSNEKVYLYPIDAYAVGDKLLICCRGSTPGIYLPLKTDRFYFELDFDTGNVCYAGFSRFGNYEAKTIVKF